MGYLLFKPRPWCMSIEDHCKQPLPALPLPGLRASGGLSPKLCLSPCPCAQTRRPIPNPAWSSSWVPSQAPTLIWSWTLGRHFSGTLGWRPEQHGFKTGLYMTDSSCSTMSCNRILDLGWYGLELAVDTSVSVISQTMIMPK